jgi:hypothetical protein
MDQPKLIHPTWVKTCAATVAPTRMAAKITTSIGPTLMPGVSSSKNRIRPAPPLGMGPSPFFFRFLAVLGIPCSTPELTSPSVRVLLILPMSVLDSDKNYTRGTCMRLNPRFYTCTCVLMPWKYSWSIDVGRGFCYSMSKLVISTERRADESITKHNSKVGCRVWASAASSLLLWIKKSLLGLTSSVKKKEVSITAPWILGMPRDWRIAFARTS